MPTIISSFQRDAETSALASSTSNDPAQLMAHRDLQHDYEDQAKIAVSVSKETARTAAVRLFSKGIALLFPRQILARPADEPPNSSSPYISVGDESRADWAGEERYILGREELSKFNALHAKSASARHAHGALALAYGRALEEGAFPGVRADPRDPRQRSSSALDGWENEGGSNR